MSTNFKPFLLVIINYRVNKKGCPFYRSAFKLILLFNHGDRYHYLLTLNHLLGIKRSTASTAFGSIRIVECKASVVESVQPVYFHA